MRLTAKFVGDGVSLPNQEADEGILIKHNIDLQNVRGGLSDFQHDAFFSCACLSLRTQSQAFARLRDQQNTKPIGWIIPSLYFSEPSEFYDTKLLADFAYAAFYHFWTKESYAGIRDYVCTDSLSTEYFSDIISEEIGFIVISKESFKKTKISLIELKLSLLRNGIFVLDSGIHHQTQQENINRALTLNSDLLHDRVTATSFRTLNLPDSCKSIDNLLGSIFDLAHKELFGVGGFLYLYQVAEYLMEINFSEKVLDISNQGNPAWKLKRKLGEVASEAFRLRDIARRAAENAAHTLVFDKLGVACQDFIKICLPSEESGDKTWIDSVYAVRNLLVHNHLAILREGASFRLEKINSLLHMAVLELIFCYK